MDPHVTPDQTQIAESGKCFIINPVSFPTAFHTNVDPALSRCNGAALNPGAGTADTARTAPVPAGIAHTAVAGHTPPSAVGRTPVARRTAARRRTKVEQRTFAHTRK